MRVSILIPTLNRVGYLRESVASARGQTHPNIEILISDDGSNDNTPDFVREVTAVDPRVRFLPRNPHPGLFTNFNHLIEHITGEAFCVLADDDRLCPEFVATLLGPLERHPDVVASFADHWIIDWAGNRSLEWTDFSSQAYRRDVLPEGVVAEPLVCAMCQTMCIGFSLYRTAVFRDEPFDPSLGGAADVDYTIRAALRGKLYYVPLRVAEYRAHSGTTTATRSAFMIDGAVRVWEKYSFSDPRAERERIRRLLDGYATQAYFYAGLDTAAARAAIRKYYKAGGQSSPKILAAAALSVLPTRVTMAAKLLARKLRAR